MKHLLNNKVTNNSYVEEHSSNLLWTSIVHDNKINNLLYPLFFGLII